MACNLTPSWVPHVSLLRHGFQATPPYPCQPHLTRNPNKINHIPLNNQFPSTRYT